MIIDIWKTTSLDEAIAEEFFGWKWVSFLGRPTRNYPNYPKKMRVRQFLRPESTSNDRWKKFLAEHDGALADGSEPLAYCYCSSRGPAIVPHFSGHESDTTKLERELRKRDLWKQYRGQLWAQVLQKDTDGIDIDESRLADADCKTRCIAALVVVESKFLEMSGE